MKKNMVFLIQLERENQENIKIQKKKIYQIIITNKKKIFFNLRNTKQNFMITIMLELRTIGIVWKIENFQFIQILIFYIIKKIMYLKRKKWIIGTIKHIKL